MVTANDVGWGAYLQYEGPWYKGSHGFALPSEPTDEDRLLAVVTSTEGGRGDAINCYDRMILSAGFIQLGEAGIYAVSDLLGYIANTTPDLLAPLQPGLGASGATFRKNAKGRWRFAFNDSRGEVDTVPEQQQLFLLHSNGLKGSWDDASKAHAKLWAACVANTLGQPEALVSQVRFLAPRLRGYAFGSAKPTLFGENLPDEGWVGALRAGFLSFAANLPAVAAKHLEIALAQTNAPKWSPDWCITILKELTFGPGIAIYPARYNAIRPVIEQLYQVNLPDFAPELQKWKQAEGLICDGVSPDFDTVQEIQQELIEEGYDLGPCGADGKYGQKTQLAVLQFQRLHGLTPDGVVGPLTRKALIAEVLRRC